MKTIFYINRANGSAKVDANGQKVKAKCETLYPHAEPLREWKVQVFQMGEGVVRVEIVTLESWKEVAEGLLDDLDGAFKSLDESLEKKIEFSADGEVLEG